MKKMFYKMVQVSLRKVIDWLLTAWSWANNHVKTIEAQDNDRK